MQVQRTETDQDVTTPKIYIGKGLFCLVDRADYVWLKAYRWFALRSHSCWYAARRVRRGGKETYIRMHREITAAKPGEEVHHKNGNSVDNRRCNLQVCTPEEHRMYPKNLYKRPKSNGIS